MKYGYEDVENNELIQNYKTSDDKIIITFLDGSSYEIPLTKENEAGLLNLMLEQAYDRSESSALHDAQEKRKKLLKCAALEMWLTLLSVVNAAITDFNNMRICASIFGCLTSIIAIGFSAGYKFKTDEIKELEKYDIYLLMREAL